MRNLGQHPIYIFGAGATKACGGPLTAEILPSAFKLPVWEGLRRKDLAQQVDDCLVQHFHVPALVSSRTEEHYPPLPLVLSLLDLAIDQDRPLVFGKSTRESLPQYWDRVRLVGARSAIEYLIFAVLNEHLRSVSHNWYEDLFAMTRRSCPCSEPCAISLNYDILLDNVLFRIAEHQCGPEGRPAYGCDIQTTAYRSRRKEYGRILKLHGSLNWLYCASCRRLDIGMSDCGRSVVTCKVLDELYNQTSLDEHYSTRVAPCPDCGTPLRAVMITPTRAKDYRNPHIQAIWYETERLMRSADHACFIGYSLPDDDIEVIDLLRRGLGHLDAASITVVEYDDQQRPVTDHPVGRRYRSLFGSDIAWHTGGFASWIRQGVGASASGS